MDYAFIWAALIAFAVLAYVVLDGFDLGVGILFLSIRPERLQRERMMNSVAPVWDGNETWLVLGGGGLFAVFPLAYAIIMPALYIPITLMLLALVFRGVAFEFRPQATRTNKRYWDKAFCFGSTLAAFMQGISLGTLVRGIEVEGRAYAGGVWDWLSPFSLTVGVAVVCGYALLGACWLVYKTDGWLQRRMREWAWFFSFATLALIIVISLWTPFLNPDYVARWVTFPNAWFSALVPLLLLACTVALFRGLEQQLDLVPFLSATAIFILCFAGIGISFYPHIVPPDVTIWQAAGPDKSLGFLLAGAAVLLPVILAYTAYSYRIFRGKVLEGDGYH